MKKISILLSSIVMGSLLVIPCYFIKDFKKVNTLNNVENTNLNTNRIENQINENESSIDYNYATGYAYNPAYPTFSKSMNYSGITRRAYIYRYKDMTKLNYFNGSYDFQREISKEQENQFWGMDWTLLSIDVLNHASSKTEFLKNYKTISAYFYFGYNFTNDSNSNWQHGNAGPNIGTPWNARYSFNLNENNFSNEFIYGGYSHSSSRKHEARAIFSYSWSGNQLIFKISTGVKLAYNSSSAARHGAYIGINARDITFNTSFNVNSLKQKVNSAISPQFKFESDTSPNLNSTEKNGVSGGSVLPSNKEKIDAEITKRLKSSFGVDYEAWFGGVKPILKKTEKYDISNSIVTLTLKDEGTGSFKTQFVYSVSMKVVITLSDYYYQRAAQKRLTVEPGLIVDPTKTIPTMIEDRPEFDPKTNTFTYHNSVSVQYVEDNQNQNKEKIYLNGLEQQMYNGISRFEIVDDREDGTASEIVHKISVSGLKGDDLVVNIVIKSLSTDISWKWLGWDPSNNQNQANLIEKKLPNGEVNPDYDPTINEKTGMRNQFVFVNADVNDKYKYPFYVDPLDKYGILIRDEDEEKMDKLLNGYIAEAYVANSGIIPIDGYSASKASKIERVKLDYETFEPISTPQTVDPTKQETYEGLYHYIIYLKDYVEKVISPSDPITPSTPSYTAKQGSTLHKLVYISNDVESFAQFTNITKINQSGSFSEFWSSIPGKHLKNYLIKEKMFDTKKIHSLNYEQLILYWKQYVSDQKQQLVDPPTDPVNYKNLQSLEISDLKLNSTDKNTVIDKINKYVEDKIAIFSSTSKVDVDYEILVVQNSLETSLKKFDFSDFLDNSIEVTKIDIKIKSKIESTLLTGSQNFIAVNNKDYDETKVLDLSEITVNPLSFNFSSSNIESDVFLENYIYDYTRQIIELYRPEDVDYEYIYGEDYFISLNGLKGEDIKTKSDLVEIVNQFLTSNTEIDLKITIISIDESIKLTGYTSYIIQNQPDSDNIAPEKPDPPTRPFDPNGENCGNNEDEIISNEFVKANLWWIITVILLSAPAIGVPVWIKMRKKKTKIK